MAAIFADQEICGRCDVVWRLTPNAKATTPEAFGSRKGYDTQLAEIGRNYKKKLRE